MQPDEARALVREHFSSVTKDEFQQRLSRSSGGLPNAVPCLYTGEEHMTDLTLFSSAPASLPLDAYLACALSNLDTHERQLVFQLSDTISMVASEQNINVYEPRKQTDPVHHPDIPDFAVFKTDRERVLNSDLLIVLTHFASFGAGEELGFAYSAMLPIIIISHSDMRVSRMVTGIPSYKIHLQYTEPEELRSLLRETLVKIRPVLEQRKMAFSEYDVLLVGDRVRRLREELRMTRQELAQSVPHMTPEEIEYIETSSDRLSNPSLLQLRQIATVLKTTVAELVEPDPGQRVLAVLQEWVEGRAAARGGRLGDLPARDRNRILRRILLRFVDTLEKDDD